MSRLAKRPIEIPKGVEVKLEGDRLVVKGPKGQNHLKLHPDVKVEIEDGKIWVRRPTDRKFHKAIQGTTWALIRNAVKGVSEGFSVRLEVVGLGYRVAMKGRTLELNLGYSHPIRYEPPEGVEVKVEGNNKIVVFGVDKQKVGQVAAIIRDFRRPDPYKGKGIRYEGEELKLKPGKQAGKK